MIVEMIFLKIHAQNYLWHSLQSLGDPTQFKNQKTNKKLKFQTESRLYWKVQFEKNDY